MHLYSGPIRIYTGTYMYGYIRVIPLSVYMTRCSRCSGLVVSSDKEMSVTAYPCTGQCIVHMSYLLSTQIIDVLAVNSVEVYAQVGCEGFVVGGREGWKEPDFPEETNPPT